MRKVLIKAGKSYSREWFQVIVLDTFTGESIIIDDNHISKTALSHEEYLKLSKVQDMINSDKPLCEFSLQ